MLPSPLSRQREIVDENRRPTQLMHIYTEQVREWFNNPEISGSITFTGEFSRILGQFSSQPHSTRTLFKSISENLNSTIGVIPNGTATASAISLYNAEDPDNSSQAILRCTSSSAGVASSRRGTGVFLPLQIETGGTARYEFDTAGNFKPITDNSYTCGASGFRFSSLWAANGTIQTSDERNKCQIQECNLGLDFINFLNPVSYKFIVGGNKVDAPENEGDDPLITQIPGKRTHYGLIAQEVKAACDAFGVDFGGHILTDMNDQDSQQGLRYDQLIAPVIKALQELSAKVEYLESIQSQ